MPSETMEILAPVPIKPLKTVSNYQSKPYKYYQSIKLELVTWWDEFKAVKSEGGYVYSSVKQFIATRTKNKQEQRWIMEMIGPEPELDENESPKIPWLGDWYEMRLLIRIFPNQIGKVQKVLEGSLATTSESVLSMRPLAAYRIARHMREIEQLDDIFGGQLFDPRFSIFSEENAKRLDMYFKWFDMVYTRQTEAMHLMQELNGVSRGEDGTTQVIQFNQVNQQQSEQQQVPTGLPQKELELLKLARTLQYHSEKLRLPLKNVPEPPKEIEGQEIKKDKVQ